VARLGAARGRQGYRLVVCLSLAHKLGKKIDRAKLGAVRLKDATCRYDPPFPWSAKAYEELRGAMNGIPEGEMRNAALKGIERLDCGNPDKKLASCDPAAAPPPEVLDRQKKLEAASVDETAYAKALAAELRGLVCAHHANAIHILRGVFIRGGVDPTGPEAPALVDFIMSKDCPVSASLTGDDEANLLKSSKTQRKNSHLRRHRRKTNKGESRRTILKRKNREATMRLGAGSIETVSTRIALLGAAPSL
jgi:hypothetical protein